MTTSPRLLVLVEGEASALPALIADAGAPGDTLVVTVEANTADRVAEELPALLDTLTDLEIAVLAGPLASETWRRHGSFQLHVTLIDAPDADALPDALRGAVAMLD